MVDETDLSGGVQHGQIIEASLARRNENQQQERQEQNREETIPRSQLVMKDIHPGFDWGID